jgi:toxin ParE1/3/4
MKLRWDTRAIRDLRDIRKHIAAQSSPKSAERVRLHLHDRINRLPANPLVGVLIGNGEIRILQPTRYPYRIYYAVQGDEVVILHIRHTARRAPDDLGV